jgi:hypothetical protein
MRSWREFVETTESVFDFAWGTARRIARRPYNARVANGRLPRLIVPQTVYILREDGDDWQASMRCPCGCRATIELNLLTDERPCWRATIEPDKSVTLKPSVWRHTGCLSHFVMRQGRIVWCK